MSLKYLKMSTEELQSLSNKLFSDMKSLGRGDLDEYQTLARNRDMIDRLLLQRNLDPKAPMVYLLSDYQHGENLDIVFATLDAQEALEFYVTERDGCNILEWERLGHRKYR